jgi:aminoglycoside phosphotransferase (APT) family kinase protein
VKTRLNQEPNLPSNDSVRALLDIILPNSSAFKILPLAGSYSNYAHLVEVETSDGTPKRVVLRRYAGTDEKRAKKALREFKTLELLRQHNVPAPHPLYLDEAGALLGSPGIVTRFVPGEVVLAQPASSEWAKRIETVAQMLALIHATPYDDRAKSFLMDADQEAVWFLKSDAVPPYMAAHPDGTTVWRAVRELRPHIEPAPQVLIHLDYWSGNILWNEGQIAAIVDWEEAAYGQPAVDVAYCRMELFLEGLDDVADEFLRIYEAETGRKITNLGFWELAAAARPMTDLSGWLTRPGMAARFRRFITNARKRAGC